MIRYFQSAAITIFFLVMMFFLFRDHVVPSWNRGGGIEVDRNVLTDSWSNQDEWMTIEFGEYNLGAMRTTADWEEEEDFYWATAHVEIDAPFIKGRVMTAVRLNHGLELESARLRAHLPGFNQKPYDAETLDGGELPPGAFELLARVDGKDLRLRMRRDDAVRYDSVRLARPVTIADSLTPIFRGQMLTKGVTYSVDIYEPLWGNKAGKMEVEYLGNERVEAGGEQYYAKKIEMRMGTNRSLLYTDESGTVLKREFELFGSGATEQKGEIQGTTLVLEHIDQMDGSERYPQLDVVPREPEVTREAVTGENQGEVLQRVSIFSVLSGGLVENLASSPEGQ